MNIRFSLVLVNPSLNISRVQVTPITRIFSNGPALVKIFDEPIKSYLN